MILTFLSPVGTIGGAERVLLSWVNAARQVFPYAQFKAILFADGPLRNCLEECAVQVAIVSMPADLSKMGDTAIMPGGVISLAKRVLDSVPRFVQYINQLRCVLAQQNPTLIHSHGLKAHLLASLTRPPRVPVIWHLHDFYAARSAAKWAIKILRRSCSLGIAISDAVRRDFVQLVPGVSCVAVRNTTDVNHFTPLGQVAHLDALAGLAPASTGTVRIGLVSTYANWKGHGLFLDALARLPQTPAVRGYIIGGPIYQTAGSQVSRHELEQQVVTLGLSGKVGFIPFQADTAPVYRALDVVAHASTRPEPFGLTIAEAMSCGRAVVVSAAGGAAELFRDGVDAIGFQPGNVSELVDRLTILAGDPSLRDRLGQEARQCSLRKFAPDRLPTEVHEVYQRVIRRS